MHSLKLIPLILAVIGLATAGCSKKTEPTQTEASKPQPTATSTTQVSTKSSPPSNNADKTVVSTDEATPSVVPTRPTNDEKTPPPGTSPTAEESAQDETAPEESAEPSDADSSSTAIATVNGEKIPDTLFQTALEERTKNAGEISDDRLNRIKQNILRRLVDEAILRQAVDAAKITVPDEKLEEVVTEFKERFESDERFNNYLRHSKITIEDIKKKELQRLKIEVLLLQRGAVKVTDKEAMAFYQKNKRFYVKKAGVKASHILVKLSRTASKDREKAAKEKIKLIQKKLKAGEAFADVAKRMSEDLSAPRGGDMGFFGKGHMVPAFEKVAFSLPINQVSKPVRTHFGYHLIKIHERREERVPTYDEVRAKIQRSLTRKLYFMQKRQLLSDLKNTAVVESLLPGVNY